MGTRAPGLAALLIMALVPVVPADRGYRVDPHTGQPLHPVFAHEHPNLPPETEGRTALASPVPRLQVADGVSSGRSVALTGEVLPLAGELPSSPAAERLSQPDRVEPLGRQCRPPYPPPQLG